LLRAGLGSNWGTLPPAQHYTTYNARTFLQPQLNKAVRRDQRATLGDRNPKDYVIFDAEAFAPLANLRDNTGSARFEPDMVRRETTAPPDTHFPPSPLPLLCVPSAPVTSPCLVSCTAGKQ